MIQGGNGAGFLFEARFPAGISGDIGWQNLNRYVAAQARIAGVQ